MPYTDADRHLPPHLHVISMAWPDDPTGFTRSLEPLRERLRTLRAAATSDSSDAALPVAPSSDSDAGQRRQAAEALEGLVRAGERVLAEIESLECAKARLEADLLSAYAALHSIGEQQVAALPAGSPSRMTGKVSTARVVGEEIALATGVGVGEVARRLSLATSPRRHRTILAALRAGTTSLHRALQVASDTSTLHDADVELVEEAVLAPTRDGQPVPQRTFMTRLRRAIASVDSRGSQERRAQARGRRGVFGRLTTDGMGSLTLVTDADALAAVMDRLDSGARTLRGEGDPRNLDQLRCDLATEALLRSHLGAAHAGSGDHPTCGDAGSPASHGPAERGPRDDGSDGGSDRGSDRGSDSTPGGSTFGAAPGDSGAATANETSGAAASSGVAPSEHRTHAAHPTGSMTGQPAALVWLVMPFEVAVGLSDAACELPGHGWVTAAHAREIMTRPGSAWRTLPVDVDTGQALSRPTKAYRPTRAMVEHVQAVDGMCRGPGCEVLSSRCDIDHETPWPHGETTTDNLFTKHRLHHNLKTAGIWTSRLHSEPAPGSGSDTAPNTAPGSGPLANRSLEWTTLTGRTYVTRPKDWRRGLDPVGEMGGVGESGWPDQRPPQRQRHPRPGEPPPF